MDKKSKPVRKKTLTVVYKESIFVNVRYHVANQLLMLLGTFIGSLVLGCSNSEGIENDAVAFLDIEDDATPLSTETDYLPLDDSEYPYAGIPRIVIETEKLQKVKDQDTEIPAKLQIWGEREPESEVKDLTIRGRGNTSWTEMPKKSYKIEFIDKQSMLGMPKDRDWALIANYADKTLMKNYLAYHLSAELGAYYAPRCKFAELYLNREYLGVYLLTETIKIGKNRINIPQNEDSFIVEIDSKYRKNEQVVFSDVLSVNNKPFTIHYPKNASDSTLLSIQKHIQDFESLLKNFNDSNDIIPNWLNIEEYIKFYWVQEFSKNPDANFYTSIYFSWEKNGKITMGPVWDFDLAFGGYDYEAINKVEDWHPRYFYWNQYLFKDSIFVNTTHDFWSNHQDNFSSITNILDSMGTYLENAAQNNFKKWNILESTDYKYFLQPYSSYKEALGELRNWIVERKNWINKQYHIN